MKKVMLTICLMLVVLCGCSTVQTAVTFRKQRIVVGQSSDSIEKLLGQPDWALSARIQGRYSLKASKVDMWVSPGVYTIEWGYWENPNSLILWLEGNAVQAIWLAKTTQLK